MGTRQNFLKIVYQAKISLKTHNERKTCASIIHKWRSYHPIRENCITAKIRKGLPCRKE